MPPGLRARLGYAAGTCTGIPSNVQDHSARRLDLPDGPDQSGGGPPHSKTLARPRRPTCLREVLDYGSPLPLSPRALRQDSGTVSQ